MPSRLYLLAAALLWSTAGAAIKLCALTGPQIAAGRSAVAALVLLAALPAARRRPSRKALGVAIAYALTVGLFVMANKLTTAANAIFLQDTAPLYVLLLSPRLLGERPSRKELWTVPVFLLGLGLFFADQLTPGQKEGNALALAAGVAFALCIMGLRSVGEEGPVVLVVGNLLTALMAAPLALGGPLPTWTDLGILVFLGVFQLGISYVLFMRGLSGVPALEASLIILLEPVLNPVWTFALTGERPGPWAVVGGAIILGATGWTTYAGTRRGG